MNYINSCHNYCNNKCNHLLKHSCCMPQMSNGIWKSGEIGGFSQGFTWTIQYNINYTNIEQSTFKVRLFLYGVLMIDSELNAYNPTAPIDIVVGAGEFHGELGVNFDKRQIYFEGALSIAGQMKTISVLLLKF